MTVDVVDVSRPQEAFRAAIGMDGPILRAVALINDTSCAPEPSRTSL